MADFTAPEVTAEEFHKKGLRPILLLAQPKTFKVLKDPHDLQKWEEMLVECLGLKAGSKSKLKDLHTASNTSCESNSPTSDCDED